MKKITLLLSFIACVLASQAQSTVTIKDIQTPKSATNDTSSYAKQIITTHGTVVGIYSTSAGVRQGFYIQDAAGGWNGLYVYYGTTSVGTVGTCIIGDSVTVTGTVSEYNGLTELTTITACSTIASNKTYTINDVTTADAQTEKWESCIIRVKNATCIANPTTGNYTVNDGSGSPDLDIFKQLFQTLALTTGTKYNIIGIMTWYKSGAMFEAYPRSAADISISTGLSTPSADNLAVSVAGKKLTITNSPSSSVEIFNSVGAKVQSVELINGSADLNLGKGVYVVRAGKATAKIIL